MNQEQERGSQAEIFLQKMPRKEQKAAVFKKIRKAETQTIPMYQTPRMRKAQKRAMNGGIWCLSPKRVSVRKREGHL